MHFMSPSYAFDVAVFISSSSSIPPCCFHHHGLYSSWWPSGVGWTASGTRQDQQWNNTWTPTKASKVNEDSKHHDGKYQDWNSPTGFKTTHGLPSTFVQTKSHLKFTARQCSERLPRQPGVPSTAWLVKAWNRLSSLTSFGEDGRINIFVLSPMEVT